MKEIRLSIPKGDFKEYTGEDKHSSIDGYNIPRDYMSNPKHSRDTWKHTGTKPDEQTIKKTKRKRV